MTSPALYFDADMDAPRWHPAAGGHAVVFCGREPGKATANEDAAAVIPVGRDSAVLVVADGMGGGAVGEEAAQHVVRALVGALTGPLEDPHSLRSEILDAVEAGNRAVIEMGVGAGTTVAVVEIQGHSVRPYHVGDSAVLAVGQRGKLRLRTLAHSPVGYAVEAGLLDSSDAMHHEDRHLVSNLIGSPDMRIEIGSAVKLSPRDTVLIASDGLVDNLHEAEIVDRIRVGPLAPAVVSLVADARTRMHDAARDEPSKPDDLAVVAFRFAGASGLPDT